MVIVSALALAAAYVLTTAPHELAHSVTAAVFGLDPVWHGDRAPHRPGTAGQEALIALAGPLYSLLSGTLVLTVTGRARGYLGLLGSWLGLLSVAGFAGYLISGAFVASGDIPDALRLLGAPVWVGWLGAVIGVAGLLVVVARVAAIRLSALAPRGWSARQAIRGLGLLAVPVAAGLVLAASIPAGPPLIAQMVILVVALLVALTYRGPRRPTTLAARVRLPGPVVVLLVLAARQRRWCCGWCRGHSRTRPDGSGR